MARTETWNTYKKHPDEQEYMADTEHAANVDPTREELHDLSKACSRLWELDINRLVPGKDFEIECGRGTKVYREEDMAAGNLFTWLSNSVLRRPTYSTFCSLLDNYNPDEGYREVVTSEEKHEEAAFMEEISRTAKFPDSEIQVLSIQFEWNGTLKSVSTVLVGVSPEFEIALYTLCFFGGEEDNHVQLGPYFVNIKCYRLGRDEIGSAFPVAEY
ncbi:hypothetical protein ZIOFF_031267 [Zingiber officinale]|uniref:EndoU domain-containing protein n=1 Tax=Zingiber officinale TaxID=94328 RepID=A0A8J5L060_ZINOF|nr:hypothetical protein ZIOFF_031267 [Zingiber officinale]